MAWRGGAWRGVVPVSVRLRALARLYHLALVARLGVELHELQAMTVDEPVHEILRHELADVLNSKYSAICSHFV